MNNTPSYADTLRKLVGYSPTSGVVGDWRKGAAYSRATETSERDDDLTTYLLGTIPGAFLLDADARTTFMVNLNRGQLMDDKDRMTVAQRDKERAQKLIDIINNKDIDDNSKLDLIATSADYTGLLKDGKFDSKDIQENVNKLHKIIQDSTEDYDSAFEDYQTDMQDMQDWKDSHSVSDYYTRKSQQESSFDNWYYTQPAQQGLSLSSWKEQATSIGAGLLAAWGGAKAGAAIGAAGGSVAPGVGTAIGALAGGISGAIAGLIFGGAQAREQESHIEAYDAYQQKFNDIVADKGLNVEEAANSIRKQAKQLGYGSAFDEMDDNEVVALTAADTRFKLDSKDGLDLKQALDDAYVGTRRVYERNNALGAGEFAKDVLMYMPLRAIPGASQAVKLVSKLNPLKRLLNVTRKTNIDIAELASSMRNSAIRSVVGQIAKRRGISFLEESTEEGAQHIIQNEFLRGQYDNEQASDDWWDALTNFNMLSDIGDNIYNRALSGATWLGIDTQYKNDHQLGEEMWAGGLMSLLSPQGAVFGAKEIIQSHNDVKHAYGMGKYISEALSKNADIGSLEAFYRNMRKYNFADSSSYREVLDLLRDELKSGKTGKDGHTTRRYKFDTEAISQIKAANRNLRDEDGNPIEPTTGELTDSDIDAFIDEQGRYASNLFAIKSSQLDPAWKRIKSYMTNTTAAGEELDSLNKQLEQAQFDAVNISHQLLNNTDLDSEERKKLKGQLKQVRKQEKELQKQIKAGSKQAVDTDLQDAWYALTTMAYADNKAAEEQKKTADVQLENILRSLDQKVDRPKFAKALGLSNEENIPAAIAALSLAHQLNQAKIARNTVYGQFLTAQRAAMHAEAPVSLSNKQEELLSKLDARINQLTKQLDDITTGVENDGDTAVLDRIKKQGNMDITDLLTQSDNDRYNNSMNTVFDNGDFNPEDINNYVNAMAESNAADIASTTLAERYDFLRNGDPKQIRARVEQYRKANRESFQAQQESEKVDRDNTEANQAKYSSIKDWLAGATNEQIGNKVNELDSNLDRATNQFGSFVQSLPMNSRLRSDLTKALNYARTLSEASNNSKPVLVNTLRSMVQDLLRQYDNKQDPNIVEANKQLLGLWQNLLDIDSLNQEAAARDFEHKLPGKYTTKNGKPIRVDSDTYTDDEGNLYNIDLGHSTYSENNGLTLRLTRQAPNAKEQEQQFDKILDRLQKGKEELEGQLKELETRQWHGEDVDDELIDAYRKQLDQTNGAIAETNQAKQNVTQDAVLDVKYGDELLDKIYYKTNSGAKSTVNERYKLTNDRVVADAKERRAKRFTAPGMAAVQYNEVANITASFVRDEIGNIEDMTENSEVTRAVAYSLGDTNSKRAAAIIGSPYYQAKYWSGFFAYTMDESEVDSWKTVPDSRKKAAKNAIKKFNSLIQQIAYLKSVGKVDEVAKFLDEATAMLTDVPVGQQKDSDYVILASADSAKPEYGIKVTRAELLNIIKFLPVKAYLRNPRYKEGKSYVPLVVQDLKGETQAYTEDGKFSKKFLWRFELAKVLLQNAHMRKKAGESAESQLDERDTEADNMSFDTNTGYDDTQEQESKRNRKSKPYATTVSIPRGSIDITFEKYNQKVGSPQFDPEARLFYDANGRRIASLPQEGTLTEKAAKEAHRESLQQAIANRDANSLYHSFANNLSIIFGNEVTIDQLKQQYEDTDLTVLEHIILQGILYGDGIILRDSFANATVSNSKLFNIGYKSTSTKNQSVEKNKRIDDLFNLIQDTFANEFFSFNNSNLQGGTKQIVTADNVANYIANGLFSRTGNRTTGEPGNVRVLIKDDDETWRALGNPQSPVRTSNERIAEILNQLDQLIDTISTPDQFFSELQSRFDNIKFQFSPDPSKQSEYTEQQKEAFAMELISSYIRNRKFGRLNNPSSLTDALISGNDHPKNGQVANRRFFAKPGQVIQSNIDQIDSLHIVESDGVFYFDLPSFANRSVRYSETDESGKTVSTTDVEAEQQIIDDTRAEVIDPLNELLQKFFSNKKIPIKALVDFMNDNYSKYSRYAATKDLYDAETHQFQLLDDNGKPITKRGQAFDAINAIINSLDDGFQVMRNEVAQKLLEQIETAAKDTAESSLSKNGKQARVEFAIGSYKDGTGQASVLRSENGTMIPMRGVSGTPGAVYLILPSWMNASGKHRIVHLNGRKLVAHQAAFIARLLDAVRQGRVAYNGAIPADLIPGYIINTTATVDQLLDTLINIGVKNLERDRSGRAISSLLFVDNDNQVHFGSEILNDTNLNDLIQFLQNRKQIRVDRSKLLSQGSTVGINANIELTDDSEFIVSGLVKDKAVFSLDGNEDYQHYVISKGVLRSDLNPDRGARMYNNTILAINTSFTGNKAIPNPANSKKAGSAANAQKAVADEGFVSKEAFMAKMQQPSQQAIAAPVTSDSAIIPYTEDSFTQFVTQQLGTSQFIPIDTNGEQVTMGDHLAAIKGYQESRKQDGGVYKQYTASFLVTEGDSQSVKKVKVPLRQAVQAQAQVPVQAPITIVPAHAATSPFVAPQVATQATPQVIEEQLAAPEFEPTFADEVEQPATSDSKPSSVILGRGVNNPTPATQKSVKTPENASQGHSTATPTQISTLTRLMSAIASDPMAFKSVQEQVTDDDDSRFLEFLLKYANSKLGIKGTDLMTLNEEIQDRQDDLIQLRNRYLEYAKRPPFYGSILNFLDKYVEKEDYETAQARAVRILGNPEIRFTSDMPFTYDSNRKAFIYVFGQCTEAFMHIYRSAKGQVAAGVMDHEAFHKISLFVLNPRERKQLYADIRAKYEETKDMSDQQVEEFAADLFKDFVNKYEKQGVTGFYSNNKFVSFFQKLYDYGTKMLRKIFGLRTQPGYRGIQSLFEDMYTGRYAYAKATKENAELFNELYHDAPFSGIMSLDGKVVVAKNNNEHTKLIRTILTNLVTDSKLLDTIHGYHDLSPVFNTIRQRMQATHDGLTQAMITALANDDVTTYVRLQNQQRVYKMLLDDAVWADYTERIENLLRREFKMNKQQTDPNELMNTLEDKETDAVDNQTDEDTDNTEEYEDEVDAEDDNASLNLGFTEERDSLQRNMWNSADITTKILFWVIPQDTVTGNKLNYMGLTDYANPAQMYIKFTELLQDCASEEQMMEILKENAVKDSSVQAVYEYLTQDDDPEVNQALQNKFFTSTCRYRHSFENTTYEQEFDEYGNVVAVTARSYNGNMNETTTKVRYALIRQITSALINRATRPDNNQYKSANAKQAKEAISKLINALAGVKYNKGELTKRLAELLKLSYEVNGFGMLVDGDYDLSQSVDMIMSYIWDENGGVSTGQVDNTALRSLISVFNIINNNVTGITGESVKNDEVSVKQRIRKIIDENVELQNFLKNISSYAPRQARMMSQNGPKGVRIYTIGAYNYITRLFQLWTKPIRGALSNWRDAIAKNPYAGHSVWLKSGRLPKAKLNTRLQTMTSDNFNSAQSDKYVSPDVELINRMVTVLQVDNSGKWLGGHAFPVLANKKFSADLTGLVIEALERPVHAVATASGKFSYDINIGAKQVFAGYFLDEVAAIKDAKAARDNFIEVINRVNGTKHTVQSFSELSIPEQTKLLTASEAQSVEGLHEINNALNKLVVTYHFESTKNEPVYDKQGRVVSFNTSHIDLREGAGYGHRHFTNVAARLSAKGIDFDTLDINNPDLLNAIETEVLQPGIADTIKAMESRGVSSLIPTNLVSDYAKIYKSSDEYTTELLMLATFAIRHMSDMLEYEKLVQGDMAYFGKGGKRYRKTIDGMTKRYSGPVSTFGLNASKGTRPMSLTADDTYDLSNSNVYQSLTIQTTKLIDYDVFEGLVNRSLGLPVQIDYSVDTEEGAVTPSFSHEQLLGEDGLLKKEVLNGAFKDYTVFRKQNEDGSYDASVDTAIAKSIVKDVLNRYTGYLSQNYTDATSYISSTMFRELRQRSDDGWTDIQEACWLFMEHYDNLWQMYNNRELTNDWNAMVWAAHQLGIDDETLNGFRIDSDRLYNPAHNFNSPDRLNSPKHREQRAKYRGKILAYLEDENGIPKIDTTPMKYLYYGNKPQFDTDTPLYIPIYDKTALVPMFKIFTEDHDAEHLYRLMHDSNTQFVKFDSTTKTGGGFSYQLYDENGNFNSNLNLAPRQLQYFDQLGKQLDTDAHTNPNSTLLTQLTKISMLNTVGNIYSLSGKQLNGKQLNELYAATFNSLTRDGFDRFKRTFGFNSEGQLDEEGRRKLVAKLRKILEDSGASQSVINSFDLDENGDFITTPALLPNGNQIQSRLLSQVGKIIVDTHIKGLPLYQVVSVGFDQDHPLKKGVSFDKELLSPGDIDENGNTVTRMQARVSILLFNDVINEAKKNAKLSKKYNGLTSFYDKRRFLLNNKDKLPSLVYRVPTQSQNSVIPIDIVDVMPASQGAVAQLPTTLTALTGADFDIDKLYTAVFNYDITDDGIEKVNYMDKYKTFDDLVAHMDELNTKQKENLLLDIFQSVLTSDSNLLHTTVPLDVCTDPVKSVMTKEVKVEGDNTNHDGFSLTPAHQAQMREQNANSDTTIGPMALNSVFQYYLQTTGLDFITDPQLEKLGIHGLGHSSLTVKDTMRIAYLLDVTSAMINASVDAAKDNYIGRANINSGTYDVLNFLIASGFDLDTFRFIAQPGVKQYVSEQLRGSKDAIFKVKADTAGVGSGFSIQPDLFTTEKLKAELQNPTREAQQCYVSAFAYIQSIASRYRQAISVAQVDTKKYGKNVTELMAFLQNVDDYESDYNLIFSNPDTLFENSFLKEKLNAIRDAMGMFSDIFLENSQLFKDASTRLSDIFGKRGPYSKQLLRRAVPKLKQAIFKIFFDQYIVNRFSSPDGQINYSPLYTLFCDPKLSVVARYDHIKELCEKEHNIGSVFFEIVKYARARKNSNAPRFFVVNNAITTDPNLKQAVQDSIAELFHSGNPEVRQWITDAAVMQFYQTGGTDTTSGTAVKSSFYDMLPPQELGNIEANMGNGNTTFNEFVKSGDYYGDLDQLVDEAILQLSISDDEFVPVVKTYGKANSFNVQLIGDKSVAIARKASNKLRRDYMGSRYAKYIKVQTSREETPTLYVLGNVVRTETTDQKTGELKVYYNPIYFKMNKLGYRQYGNISNSIRVDGAVFYDENGIPYRRSLFNKQTQGLMSDNRYHRFTAQNLAQLETEQVQSNGVKLAYKAKDEVVNALTKNGARYQVFDVDEVGNVLFDADNDPYRGYFETGNHRGTQLVLSRLSQAPTDTNVLMVNHAKEVGATFQQLVKVGDEYKFIGSDTELTGTVTLLFNNRSEIQEAADQIFSKYPGVNIVKLFDSTNREIISLSRGGKVGSADNSRLRYSAQFTREDAINHPNLLYIFTDNTDRTSGGQEYGEGWYKDKYGTGGFGSRRNPTTAVVRGLPNAAPISTMKWFYKNHGLSDYKAARWTDADMNQVMNVVSDEVRDILNLWESGKFDAVVFPNEDFLLNSLIAGITETRTPQLYAYFKAVKEFLSDTITGKVGDMLSDINNKKDSEDQKSKEC